MIVKRRTWLYRLPGESAIRSISFKIPVTTAQAKEAIRRLAGAPSELWGRSLDDLAYAGV